MSCYFLRKHNAESASFNLESSPIIAQSAVSYLSASHKGEQKLISIWTAFQLFPADTFQSMYLAGILAYQNQILRLLQHIQKKAEDTSDARWLSR